MITTKFPDKIWPERFIDQVRTDRTPVTHINQHGRILDRMTVGEAVWPGFPQLVEAWDGEIPHYPEQLTKTTWGEMLKQILRQIIPDEQRLEHQLASVMRNVWTTANWIEHGSRLYTLDADTCLAILHTKIDDVPADMVKLPVQSMYLQVPRSLAWKVDLTVDTPDSHPLEGFLLVNRHQDVQGLSVIACGNSGLAAPRAMLAGGDNTHWWSWDLNRPTIGHILDQEMRPEFLDNRYTEFGEHMLAHHPDVGRLIFGSLLYMTSAHPLLHAVERPPKPRGHRTTPKHRKKHMAYERMTEAAVTYVGGPTDSIQRERSKSTISDLKRKPPRPHIRGGHFRRVRVGSRKYEDQHIELRWIKPVAVGGWDRIMAWQQFQHKTVRIRTAEEEA